MKNIGILGGTFDPPHIGHLIIAEEVRQDLVLDEVWFIPSFEPPHKQDAHSSVGHRAQMVNIALEDNPFFTVNRIETKYDEPSYTVDTMEELTERHPQTNFYFIIGGDMVASLVHWKSIDRLMELTTFVGVNRPGYTLETKYPVQEVDVPLIDISSTMIRKQIGEQRSVMYFLHPRVRQYIKEHHLYE